MENVVSADKTSEKRRALGRGLDSLLPSRPVVVPAVNAGVVTANVAPAVDRSRQVVRPPAPDPGDVVSRIALDHIDDNPYQTRRNFDQKALAELAE